MALRGKASITDSTGSALFGPQTGSVDAPLDCFLINRGPNRAYITADGEDAVDDIGFNLALDEAISTRELPSIFREGNFKAVCASGETASIYWATS
jgi:hypothetical protein